MHPGSMCSITFPIIGGLLEVTASPWLHLASMSLCGKHTENQYRTKQKGCLFLFQHPIGHNTYKRKAKPYNIQPLSTEVAVN